jgi:effector-binding domain-containing protein
MAASGTPGGSGGTGGIRPTRAARGDLEVITVTLTYDILKLNLHGTCTAVVRGEMPRDELPAWLAGVITTVRDYLHRVHVARTGPPFARYTFLGDTVAVEAGFPVAREVPGDGLVEPSRLPAGTAVGMTHVGGYDALTETYLALRVWLRDHGHAPVGPHWEIYLTNPFTDPDPAHWRTDMVQPYRDT